MLDERYLIAGAEVAAEKCFQRSFVRGALFYATCSEIWLASLEDLGKTLVLTTLVARVRSLGRMTSLGLLSVECVHLDSGPDC